MKHYKRKNKLVLIYIILLLICCNIITISTLVDAQELIEDPLQSLLLPIEDIIEDNSNRSDTLEEIYNMTDKELTDGDLSSLTAGVTNVIVAKVTEEDIAEYEAMMNPYGITEYEETVTKYTSKEINIRSIPDTEDDSNIIGTTGFNEPLQFKGYTEDGEWLVMNYNDCEEAFVASSLLLDEDLNISTRNDNWGGAVLNSVNGKIMGPNGVETYYNLPMGGVIEIMNRKGYHGTVWTRSDGAKMWDQYVMIAADLSKFPRGSIAATSLGLGIVVDTGGFVHNGSGITFDIATAW